MRYFFVLLIFVSLALYSNCLRRNYEVRISLVGPNRNQPIKGISKTFLEVDNIQSHTSVDIRLSSQSANLIESNAHDCHNCLFLLEFIPEGRDKGKKLYTSIKAELIANKNFEDFLEFAISEDNDVIAVKYGINRYLKNHETPNPTTIRYQTMSPPFEVPDFLTPTGSGLGHQEGSAPAEPKEEQSFFKKYFWYILIGGFILFQFLTFDKDKLMDAANQAQGGAQAGGGGRR
jgi:hypothetical protein